MQVSKFYKKKRKLQTGMLVLGLGFLSFPLFGLLGLIIHPALFFLFYLLIIYGFFKIFFNRDYLGKENSRFAVGALVLFILSWLQWLFMLGDIVMSQFILGFFFLFQSLAFFMILFVPVKNGLSLKIGALFMVLGSVVVFLNYLCVVLSAVVLFPIGFLVMGILCLVTFYRIRRGDYDPVMVVKGSEDKEIEGSVNKKKVIQRFIMYDGSLKTIKHNYRLRRNLGRSVMAGFAILAVVLIVSGIYCGSSGKQLLIDTVFESMEEGDEAKPKEVKEEKKPEEEVEDKPGKPMLVGTVGILRLFERFLFRDTPRDNEVVEEGDDFDFLSITEEDFELSYHDVKLYDNGSIYDHTTSSYINFGGERGDQGSTVEEEEPPPESSDGEGDGGGDNELTEKLKDEWFPFGGVEKKDYDIYDPLAGGTVEAKYTRETEVRGQTCYVYNVKLDNQTIVEIDDWDGNPFRVWGDEDTDYYLDAKTTIPVNLRVGLTVGVDFPDLTRLQPDFENRVENRTVTVLIKDPDSVTGWKMEEVREEHHRTSYLDAEDKNILWFENWVERYDNSTGEPLEPEQQDPVINKYAVDRTSYQYVIGYGNSQRRGYYTFPIGKIKPHDYPMWDEMANQQTKAKFIEEAVGPLGRSVYLYELKSENFTFEESDLLFPIDNPGALELVGDSTIWYWLDRETAFPLDMAMELVVSVRSGGPMHSVKEPVYKAYFELPEEDKNNMSRMVAVLAVILKCISSQSLEVFYINIQFATNLQYDLADIAKLIGYVFDTLDYYIPIITIGLGSFIMFVIILKLYSNHKKRKRKKEKLRANIKRIERD